MAARKRLNHEGHEVHEGRIEKAPGSVSSCPSCSWWLKSFLVVLTALLLAGHAQAQNEACEAVTANGVAWWTGDGVATDASGHGHDGTLANGAGYASGTVRQAFILDGVNDFVNSSTSAAWDFGSSAFTIELWVMFSSTATNATFVSHRANGSSNGWQFALSSGQLFFQRSNVTVVSAAWTPVVGNWYHLTVTRTGSMWALYVNGGAPAATGVDGNAIAADASGLWMGALSGTSNFLPGRLDEVTIYARELTQTEVQRIFDRGADGKCTCGNRIKEPGEGCDDGNSVTGDGCGASCQVEAGWTCPTQGSPCTPVCGDTIIRGGETCDDGNIFSGDGCDANCRVTACGSGVVTWTEACDDGNTVPGDGCRADCQLEDGWVCPIAGSPCVRRIACAAPKLSGGAEKAVGTSPKDVAVGDFNNDGIPDLVVVNSGSNNVSILIGDDAGNFGTAQNFALGASPNSVAVGDFNKDGKLDVVIGQVTANAAWVILGDGQGHLDLNTLYSLAIGSSASGTVVAVGDVDGDVDHNLDVLMVNRGSNNLFLWTGNGDGFFDPAQSFAVGGSPGSLAIGDFISGGLPDVAVGNYTSNSVTIMESDSPGHFVARQSFAVGASPAWLAVADFTRDGRMDLVSVVESSSKTVAFLEGLAAGAFKAFTAVEVGGVPASTAAADFNGDGKTDLVTTNTDSTISVLLGNGEGTFGFPRKAKVGANSRKVAVGDFNRDGRPDIALANSDAGSISIRLDTCQAPHGTDCSASADCLSGSCTAGICSMGACGNGLLDPEEQCDDGDAFGADGCDSDCQVESGWICDSVGSTCRRRVQCDSFTFSSQTIGVGSAPGVVAAGDFDGQNGPDLAVANEGSHNVAILLRNVSGAFAVTRTIGAGWGPHGVATADFNHDGLLDLVVIDRYSPSGKVWVYRGRGDGGFDSAWNWDWAADPYGAPGVGDADGDGNLDVLVPGLNQIAVLRGNNDVTFTYMGAWDAHTTNSLYAADFNRDGQLDFVGTDSQDNDVPLVLGYGDGTFHIAAPGFGAATFDVTVGDFNGDGYQDVASGGTSGGLVRVLLGDGAGSLGWPPITSSVGSTGGPVASADFDGDGKLDLVVRNPGNNGVLILKGLGNGQFVLGAAMASGSDPISVAVSDFDGDARPDFAVSHQSGTVSVFTNTCLAPQGGACNLDGDCTTGFCVDGVCCNGACGGGRSNPDNCYGCSIAAGAPANGTCSALTGATCNDGDGCTQTDTCQGGSCQGSNPIVCEPLDECHEPGICNSVTGLCSASLPKQNGTACNDGNACTANETCQLGVCEGGGSVGCSDGNDCTTDSCDPVTGCAHVNNTGPCDDGDACTANDTCSGGTCFGGAPPVCDDANPCTDDSCSTESGCVYTNNAAFCEDGDSCTVNDVCQDGACVAGVRSCDPIPLGGDVFARIAQDSGRPGLLWTDVNWPASVLPIAPSAVIKLDYAKKLIAGAVGPFSITLQFNAGDPNDPNSPGSGSFSATYAVSEPNPSDPNSPEAMVLYHTHQSGGSAGTRTGAPLVDLQGVPEVVVHYNTDVPCAPTQEECDNPSSNPNEDTRHLWLDQGRYLSAREKTGFLVLEYRQDHSPLTEEDFIGIEVLRVKPDQPDAAPVRVDLGSRLHPQQAIPGGTCESGTCANGFYSGMSCTTNTECGEGTIANVRRGGVDRQSLLPPQKPLVYQRNDSNFPAYNGLWAVWRNDNPYDLEVVWLRRGLLAVVWPFEIRRYTTGWPSDPAKYQKYVRGEEDDPGVDVAIPATLNPRAGIANGLYEQPFDNVHLSGDASGMSFSTDRPGWTLLQYESGHWVGFEVVRSVSHADSPGTQTIAVGTEITDPSHEGAPPQYRPGYIYEREGRRYAAAVYAGPGGTGQIFAVNEDPGKVIEVWWSNLSRTVDPDGSAYPAWPAQRVQWPSKAVRYTAQWSNENQIVIARQNGTDLLGASVYGTDWSIYAQNNPALAGFNPNDEHALAMDGKVFALRDDLGSTLTSLPYVLIQYREQPARQLWRFKVFQVVRESAPYVLADWSGIDWPADPYEKVVGTGPILPPMPMTALQYCGAPGQTAAVAGPYFKDRNAFYWAKAAGDDGGTSTVTMRYYYPVQPGFYFPSNPPPVGTCIPWLDDGTGTPADVDYTMRWPNAPTLKVGATLVNAMRGLPQIDGQCSVDILYQQSVANGGATKTSVDLIDPVQTRTVALAQVPGEIRTEAEGAQRVFSDLTLPLRERVRYNPTTDQLTFRGMVVTPTTGDPYVMLNVLSQRECQEMLLLSGDTGWQTAVNALCAAASNPTLITDGSMPHDKLALTAGLARGSGYVTLAIQNAESCRDLPVSLKVIRVEPQLDAGRVLADAPSCPFDERLTVRHSGDFAGKPEEYEFQWRYTADANGTVPAGPYDAWTPFITDPADGEAVTDVTLGGPGLLTLTDNWFTVRYRYCGANDVAWKADCNDPDSLWSDWAPPNLAPGWIKRVIGNIDPYEQRAVGGGIEGAESKFFSYRDRTVNTVVSMISQAGPRWEGNVPMNCNGLDDFGLIQIYETILSRGKGLSIDGGVDYAPANQALLLLSSRIADLYLLLGNESYADAADPTIGFGTADGGEYKNQATSLHAFENMTASLLEEELTLLRGRDDSLAPAVQLSPAYNRLLWNFTGAAGEAAYVLNYGIRDESGNMDGRITEADAKQLFPQGHGDAWGHYLTALQKYYRLMRHPVYRWEPRSEAVSIGGSAVTVDYMDERKFAQAAAARAQTGAEIVNLTYRQAYIEDPAGQWQGYRDDNPARAWGLSEWASRAGQGAYLDWVAGNALLQAEDYDPNHVGVAKIDRTTVLELRDVASRQQEVQTQLDTANRGLNPLGLATNVVPFDIDPTAIDQGKTHFEQVYDRAVSALNNAITAFNHAEGSTQALRTQADRLADFQKTVADKEVDFTNRLIEIFGYPYADDIGPGKTYPTGYSGPDLYHYDYVDVSDVLGVAGPGEVKNLPLTLRNVQVCSGSPLPAGCTKPNGELVESMQTVVFHISTAADQYGLVKPPDWTGKRRAPGEIQMARSDLLQARARFERSQKDYDALLADIEGQAASLKQQYALNASEINILNGQLNQQRSVDKQIADARRRQMDARTLGRGISLVQNALSEFLPTVNGLANDVTAPMRGALQLVGAIQSEIATREADRDSMAELGAQQAQSEVQTINNITLTTLRSDAGIQDKIRQLEQTVRREIGSRLDLYTAGEALNQSSGRYLSALAKGQRLLEEQQRFRQQTATDVQGRRYKDMAFRLFRNDALQKYRAQFDLAARYVYLAAKAYDYETTMLSTDERAGSNFLTDVVRQRLIGNIEGGLPHTGMGLADPMARMSQNFSVLKGQMGFNNPQRETNRFSLRTELFRIQPGPAGDAVWRETLRRHVVPDLNQLDEFKRNARFVPGQPTEPAIVISFGSEVIPGHNFFAWPAGGGDNAYDASHFATKVRSQGMWFSNYNGLSMLNTPRVYVIPVGTDVMRSPSIDGLTRQFTILDQKLPVPFPIGSSDLAKPGWIPMVDGASGFADIRRYSSFRAYHDSGTFSSTEVQRTDSRAIGRSVWNTRWLLVIPANSLLSDREEGLNRFIDGKLVAGGKRDGNGVTDIKLFFETYAYSGD